MLAGDKRIYTVFALMLATFLTAVDVTIVETAMPRIVGSLGGFSLLTWVITAYMLTATATMPVYGKLADLFGRKRTFTIGAVIFVAGSALCGLAQSMPQLILFRAIQGLGAGAIQPVVQTIIGDIFTPAERAKWQAWFSGVWGFSAMVGPLIGGLVVDYADWRYLFYINFPLGGLALAMLWRFLEEKLEPRQVQIDYLGSVTMTGGITFLLMALLTGGTHYEWGSPQILGMLGAAAALLALFFWQERRAPDPMLPLGLFRIRLIGIAVLASFMVGGVMYGMTVYLPVWAQGVQGFSATRSGASLLWLSIGWPLTSIIGGRFILRMGIRPAALAGLVCNLLSALMLVVMGRMLGYLPEVALAAITFVLGCGMGFSTMAFILGVQHSVQWAQRGVATAALTFVRVLGGLIWVSVMGGVMNLSLLPRLQRIPGVDVVTAREAGDVANQLLDPQQWGNLPTGQVDALRGALGDALRNVHLIVLLVAVVALGAALWLPNMRFDGTPAGTGPRRSAGGEPPPSEGSPGDAVPAAQAHAGESAPAG